MNQKQQLAFALAAVTCILAGLLAADTLWWILLPVGVLTTFMMRKLNTQMFFQFQAVDLALALIGICETVLYFCSTYQANSIQFPLICLTFIFLWFCMRLWINEINQKHLILGLLTATGGVLALLTMIFFAFYWSKVTEMGFGDLTQFRYLYLPMGMFSNDWASIMLAFLPFAAASFFSLPKPYHRLAVVACVLISLAVIVSFSRGAIFCFILYNVLTIVLLLYYRMHKFSHLALGCVIWFSVLALVCIPVRAPLLTTLAVTETNSQVRSIEGRINKWKDARQLFIQYPVTGAGSGNFALRTEPISNQREGSYTSRSTNSLMQLAAEKGIIGFSAYGLFLTVWAFGMFKTLRLRQKHHIAAMICGAGIIPCLLRETTFSTLFDKPTLLLLVILLLWFSTNAYLGGRKIKIRSEWALLLLVPIIFFGVLHTRQKNAARNNKTFVRAYEKGDDGWGKLQKSLRLWPNNALLHANEGIYMLSQIPGYDSLVFLSANFHDSMIYRAKIAFEKAVALNPADAAFHSNLGVLHWATGDTANALQHLEQSLEIAPHQPIFHVLCGMARMDDRDYSLQRFMRAVYYSPDILDSKWFYDLQTRDSTLAVSIVSDAQAMLSDSLARYVNDHLLRARLAKILLHRGKTEVAENLLQEVTQAMPNLNRPWMMLGDIAATRNDTIALQYYERAILLDPGDASAKIRVGDWYLVKGDLSKSFGYYIDALRVAYHAPTEHSRRAFPMYGTFTVANDVVSPAFYWYIRPYVDTRKLAGVIAQGYEQEENVGKAALYRQLANGEIEARKLIQL